MTAKITCLCGKHDDKIKEILRKCNEEQKKGGQSIEEFLKKVREEKCKSPTLEK
ncbi:MAG: hypothetical protein Q7K45_07220 [Nanoarchaeota archaeon]|nr:hypothetical protein [Nanoarchaeota archaeon]